MKLPYSPKEPLCSAEWQAPVYAHHREDYLPYPGDILSRVPPCSRLGTLVDSSLAHS